MGLLFVVHKNKSFDPRVEGHANDGTTAQGFAAPSLKTFHRSVATAIDNGAVNHPDQHLALLGAE